MLVQTEGSRSVISIPEVSVIHLWAWSQSSLGPSTQGTASHEGDAWCVTLGKALSFPGPLSLICKMEVFTKALCSAERTIPGQP